MRKEDVAKTQQVARLRIHVERAIRRCKEFHIFDEVISLSNMDLCSLLKCPRKIVLTEAFNNF